MAPTTRSMRFVTQIPWRGVGNADFFNFHKLFAVVGASTDRSKFGNKVLRCYQKRGYPVIPINNKAPEIEGVSTQVSLTALRSTLSSEVSMKDVGISIITPPVVTTKVIQEAYELGARSFFLQPGTYDAAVDATLASFSDAIVIKSCVLVDLDCHDEFH
jgi:predicted CoA-binding protein